MEGSTLDVVGGFPLIPEELWYERLLRYGLYFGGVFQLICILSVVFLPSSEESSEQGEDSDSSDDDDNLSDFSSVSSSSHQRSHRKLERKKRR